MCLIDCTSMTPKSSHEIDADGKFSPLLPPDASRGGSRDLLKKIAPESALAGGGTNYRAQTQKPRRRAGVLTFAGYRRLRGGLLANHGHRSAVRYSGTDWPEPPNSAGKSFSLGSPSFIG